MTPGPHASLAAAAAALALTGLPAVTAPGAWAQTPAPSAHDAPAAYDTTLFRTLE